MILQPPSESEDESMNLTSPSSSSKSKSQRKTPFPNTPDTAVSSKMSSLGSPSLGSKRGTPDDFDSRTSAKRSIGSFSPFQDMNLEEYSESKRSVADGKQVKVKLQDFLSSSEDEDVTEEEKNGVIPVHKIVWDDRKQLSKLYATYWEVDEEDVPDDLMELVEAVLKKLKANDLRSAIPALKPGTSVPGSVAQMRVKMLELVERAVDKKKRFHLKDPVAGGLK